MVSSLDMFVHGYVNSQMENSVNVLRFVYKTNGKLRPRTRLYTISKVSVLVHVLQIVPMAAFGTRKKNSFYTFQNLCLAPPARQHTRASVRCRPKARARSGCRSMLLCPDCARPESCATRPCVCVKRDLLVSKETYYSVKRDL